MKLNFEADGKRLRFESKCPPQAWVFNASSAADNTTEETEKSLRARKKLVETGTWMQVFIHSTQPVALGFLVLYVNSL